MQTQQKKEEKLRKLVEAIDKAVHEIDPTAQILNKKIVGLLIMEYPEDHITNGEVYATFMGKICLNHTIHYLKEMREEIRRRATRYAS